MQEIIKATVIWNR